MLLNNTNKQENTQQHDYHEFLNCDIWSPSTPTTDGMEFFLEEPIPNTIDTTPSYSLSFMSLLEQVTDTPVNNSPTVCTNSQNGTTLSTESTSLRALTFVSGYAEATNKKGEYLLHVTLRYQGPAYNDIVDVYAKSVNGSPFVSHSTTKYITSNGERIITCTFQVRKTNYKLEFSVRNAEQNTLAYTESSHKLLSIKEAKKKNSGIEKQHKISKQ